MNEVNRSLKSIARGTVFSVLGIFLALMFSFLQRWTIIRVSTPEEYGLYSLSLAVIALFLSIGSLGLYEGIARTISFHSSVDSPEISKKRIFSSLIFLSSVSGGICFLLLVFVSPQISSFFGKDISWIIQMVSISLPFSLLLEFLVSFFRGIERAEVKVVFQDVFKNFIFFSILVAIFVKKMPFYTVVFGYVISIVVSAVFILFYTFKTVGIPKVRGMVPVTEEMLLFSLPLLGGSIFQLITQWADTLLLGVFRTAEEVAFYSAALPTSKLIQASMAAFLFIYTPVATSLFSRGLMSEMKRVYAIVSKWVLFLTFPLFLTLFLNADVLFLFLYGSEYASAVLPFRVITVGYLFRDSFGPSQGALIAMGRTKTMFIIVSVIAATNLCLNILLIPRMGMEGAALSMVATLCVAALLRWGVLYKISGIHPFKRNFFKPALSSLLMIGGVQIILERFVVIKAWMLPFILILYTLIYVFSMVITKSIDEEDIWMLLILEKRMGFNLTFLKKIVKKFLK